MRDIDQVIARSRQEGGFSERQSFTLDYDRALEMMRSFALISPSHYILEFVQGAVACGASYVEIKIDRLFSRIAWTGGYFKKAQLSRIFDYVLSSKEDENTSAIRPIALGINALLNFEPHKIVIESGDGNLENSTRVEIDPATLTISSGRPDEPINGTYIQTFGLKNAEYVDYESAQVLAVKVRKEVHLVQQHCLMYKIPVYLNELVFPGNVSRSNDKITDEMVAFDEGDFYGQIGISEGLKSEFKILTYGVWVQSVNYDLLLENRFSGTIGFDRLTKTADHANIVRDEKWKEMWARVNFIARGVGGKQVKGGMWTAKRQPLVLSEMRDITQIAGGALLFLSTVDFSLLPKYEKTLGYPAFALTTSNIEFVGQILQGIGEVIVLEGTQDELHFHQQPKSDPPKGPFFLSQVVMDYSHNSPTKVTIYSPKRWSTFTIELIRNGRIVGSETHSELRPFLVRIDLSADHRSFSIGAFLSHFHTHFDALSERISDEYKELISPRSALSQHALRALALSTIFSVDAGYFSIRRLGIKSDEALDRPLFLTLSAQSRSLRELVGQMNQQYGLLYGSTNNAYKPERDEALDQILDLSLEEERALISIFGSLPYCRLNLPDLTFPIGKQDYKFASFSPSTSKNENHYILSMPSPKNDNEAEKIVDFLAQAFTSTPSNRHLRRHLIWILCHENTPPEIRSKIENIPLFACEEGLVSYDMLGPELEMIDGWQRHASTQGLLPRTKKETCLLLDSYVYHMLSKRKPISAQNNVSNLARADLREAVFSIQIRYEGAHLWSAQGVMGLMPRNAEKSFTTIDIVTQVTSVHESSAKRLMCSGEIEVKGASKQIYEDLFFQHSLEVFHKTAALINHMMDLEELHRYAEPALFGILSLFVVRNCRIENNYSEIDPLLDCKIFPTRTGVPVSARNLLQSARNPLNLLSEEAPDYQHEWIDRVNKLSYTHFANDEKLIPIPDEPHAWLVSLVWNLCRKKVILNTTPQPTQFVNLEGVQVIAFTQHPFFKNENPRSRVWKILKVVSQLFDEGYLDSIADGISQVGIFDETP